MAMDKVASALGRLAIAAVGTLALVPGSASGAARTPVVLFPGYTLNKVVVTVENQVVAPDCPRSGTFEDWFQNSAPSTSFSQVCRDKLLTLRYDPDPRRPMARRFSFPRGVTVGIPDYGKTESAPLYEPLYTALEAAGYVRDTSIRVAGYNPRLTPDMDRLPRAHEAVDPGDLPRQRTPAGAPRRALERADLRPVPADAHLGGLATPLHPRVHAAGRQFPGPGRALPGPVQRAQHAGLLVPADGRERHQQRAHVSQPARDLPECGRPACLRSPRGGRARRVHRALLHTARLPATADRRRRWAGPSRSPTTTSAS